ncbi:MAG: PorT family protein, partial [Gloeobacteraceae cyanobacterium ES-bin-316]|nr:PorT family protein [Ferruginibacter sp.]
TMKKVFSLLMITAAISGTSHAQLFYAQGGLNLANITNTSGGDTEDNATLASFNTGLMGRFGISKTIDLESGILLTGKGSKAETYFNGGNDYVKAKFNPLYVEVPLNLVVNFPLQKNTGIFVNAGPYAAIGVGGKSKLNTKFGPLTSSSERDIEFSDDDPFTSEQEDAGYNKLKRFDFGLNFGAGLDLDKIILKANYGLGLTKIGSTESNNTADDKNKYRVLSFSVGIPLGR